MGILVEYDDFGDVVSGGNIFSHVYKNDLSKPDFEEKLNNAFVAMLSKIVNYKAGNEFYYGDRQTIEFFGNSPRWARIRTYDGTGFLRFEENYHNFKQHGKSVTYSYNGGKSIYKYKNGIEIYKYKINSSGKLERFAFFDFSKEVIGVWSKNIFAAFDLTQNLVKGTTI